MHYRLNIFDQREDLVLALDLTPEQATTIHASLDADPDDPDWIFCYDLDVSIEGARDYEGERINGLFPPP